jgi:hypothetical protein
MNTIVILMDAWQAVRSMTLDGTATLDSSTGTTQTTFVNTSPELNPAAN